MSCKSRYTYLLLGLALLMRPPRSRAFSVGPAASLTPDAARHAMARGRSQFPRTLGAAGDGENDRDLEKVNVNLIPDVDAVTLTAVGFGLIAFNFLVLGTSPVCSWGRHLPVRGVNAQSLPHRACLLLRTHRSQPIWATAASPGLSLL